MTVFGVRSAMTLPMRLLRRVRCCGRPDGLAAAAAFAARAARTLAGAAGFARGVAAFAAAVRVVRVVFGAVFLAGTLSLRRERTFVLQRQDASDLSTGALDRAVILQLPGRQLEPEIEQLFPRRVQLRRQLAVIQPAQFRGPHRSPPFRGSSSVSGACSTPVAVPLWPDRRECRPARRASGPAWRR